MTNARENEQGAHGEREAARQAAAARRARKSTHGKRARAAWPGLTDEGRDRLRAAALANRPWEKSTGPRTKAGKARSRQNAVKLGEHATTLVPRGIVAYRGATEAHRQGHLVIPSRRCQIEVAGILRGRHRPAWLRLMAVRAVLGFHAELERPQT